MSTHNICFYGELKKIILEFYQQISALSISIYRPLNCISGKQNGTNEALTVITVRISVIRVNRTD